LLHLKLQTVGYFYFFVTLNYAEQGDKKMDGQDM